MTRERERRVHSCDPSPCCTSNCKYVTKLEAEKKAKQAAEKLAQKEAEQKAERETKAQAERRAGEEKDRKAREDIQRQLDEAKRKAIELADALEFQRNAQKAKEKAYRLARKESQEARRIAVGKKAEEDVKRRQKERENQHKIDEE